MNNKLSISDVAGLISNKSGLTKKECESLLKETFLLASEIVSSGEPLVIKGIGSFKFVWVGPRGSVDINTGASITIPGHYKLSFVPEESLRKAVNEPFAYFTTEILPPKSEREILSITDNKKAGKKISTEESEDEETSVSFETGMASAELSVIETHDGVAEVRDITASATTREEKEPVLEQPESVEEIHVSIEAAPASDATAENGSVAGTSEEQGYGSENTEEIGVYDRENSKEKDALAQQSETAEVLAEEKSSTLKESGIEQPVPAEDKIAVSENGKNIDLSSVVQQEDIEKEYRRRTRNGYIAGFVTALLLFLIIGGVSYYFYSGFRNFDITLSVFKIPFTTAHEEKTESNKPDSVVVIQKEIAPEKSKTVVSKSVVDTATIIETIEPGKFLTTIALKHYGNKIFWVYIYRENEDKIWNPRYLPKGFKVVVPPPSKYAIDSKDELSIKRAQDLEKQILYEIE